MLIRSVPSMFGLITNKKLILDFGLQQQERNYTPHPKNWRDHSEECEPLRTWQTNILTRKAQQHHHHLQQLQKVRMWPRIQKNMQHLLLSGNNNSWLAAEPHSPAQSGTMAPQRNKEEAKDELLHWPTWIMNAAPDRLHLSCCWHLPPTFPCIPLISAP